ncbi:MAG: DUF971 domain-containing protein [Verrucomicrobia bacterium]|nr:DUF971 domain-containing protein [Verrucomicrobiota bacterium]
MAVGAGSKKRVECELVGGYGLRLTWGDGHSAGIYIPTTRSAVCKTFQGLKEPRINTDNILL